MFYDVVADQNFKMLNIIRETFTRDVVNIIHLFTLIYKKSKGPHYLLISIIVSSAQLTRTYIVGFRETAKTKASCRSEDP
jgi:hypothetical protein